MNPNVTTIVVASCLIATGTYLFLSRSLVRALMGFLLLGNGANLLFIVASGPAGAPPIVGESDAPMADPVPQALVLTAIVITLGMTAFVLALAHRGRQLTGADVDLVVDDTESARIHAMAEADDIGSLSARDVADQIAAEGERTESRHHSEEQLEAGRGLVEQASGLGDSGDAPLADEDGRDAHGASAGDDARGGGHAIPQPDPATDNAEHPEDDEGGRR